MFNRKKTAAFIAGLLICAYSAVPAAYAFAEDYLVEGETEAAVSSDTYTISGDFMYSLTTDGKVCIEDCTSTAEDLVIPDTIDGIPVTELGKTALGSDHENNTFKTVTLPASINYISADNPFIYCIHLSEIKVDEKNADFCTEDGILYSKDKSRLICYPCRKEGHEFTVPDSVKNIGASALYDTTLADIKLPSGLETIEHFSFAYTDIESIDLSGTKIKEIDDYSFSSCKRLTDVKFPACLERIGGGAFASCSLLEKVTFPEGLLHIGQYSFFDTKLSEAIIPDSVEEIGYCAFGYYTSVSGETVADSHFTIVGSNGSAASTYAYDRDSDYDYQNNFNFLTPEQYEEEQQEIQSLNSIRSGDYEYAVTDIGAVLTSCYSEDDVITVPDTIDGNKIVAVNTTCFTPTQASEIILPESITDIRKMAFFQCASLKKITIPASVKTIGANVFDQCTALEEVTILGAESIGDSAFKSCTSLKTFKADGCLKEWDDEEPFFTCHALEDITITEGDGNFSSADGVLYNKDKSVLLAYPASKSSTSFIAPSGVKEIGQSAFANAVYLEKVEIPEADIINAYAFESCEKLSYVKLSETINTIEADAFYDCYALKSLRISDTISNIGPCAFGYCNNEAAEDDESAASDKLIEGFKLYTPKDSAAYHYAKEAGIEVITGTTEFFGKNYSSGFLYTIAGIIGAALIAVIGFVTGKKIKKSKAEKAAAEKREKAAERRKKRAEEEASDADENDDTDEEE